MALVWDQLADRMYEAGISKGVLYKDDSYGVAWNGLTSIDESVDSSVDPVYFDGVKFNDIITRGDFKGILKAFTYPLEFQFYEGTLEDQTGFLITGQPQTRFGLSYQTRVADGVEGLDTGDYKIHILYNVTALPSKREYKTLSLNNDPFEFEWDISTIPEDLDNFQPTAHVIFDSRTLDPNLLADLEDILYGDDTTPARLPPLKGLASWVRKWNRLIITDFGNGIWEASSPVEDTITMIDDHSFQIETETAVYLDEYTYTITSSEKNEDDIWLP